MSLNRTYKVGDADPTPDGPGVRRCDSFHPDGFGCTWRKDHKHHQHVAGTGTRVVEVWDA